MKILTLAVSLAWLAGCGSPHDELEHYRALWAERAPAAYEYTYETSGFLPHVQLIVTVRGGAVVETQVVSSQLGTPEGLTMEELFADVAVRLDAPHCDDRVSYDAAFGYPRDVYSDCGEEGDGFRVTMFRALE